MKDKKKFGKSINEILKNIDDETLQRMMEQLADGDIFKKYEKMIDETYKYKAPSYPAQTQPLPDFMETIFNAKSAGENLYAYRAAKVRMQEMPQEERESILRNFLYFILAKAQNKEIVYDKDCQLPLWSAFALIETFDMSSLWDVVIEVVVKQNYAFFKQYFDAFEPDAEYIMAKVCQEHLDELESLMHTDGFLPCAYSIIVNSVILMSGIDRVNRLKYIGWLCRVVPECIEQTFHAEYVDKMLYPMAETNATELLPMLKKLYKDYDIPPITVANYKEAEKLILCGDDEKYIDYANLEELLENIAKREKESDDNTNPFAFHDYDEEDWDDEDDDWDDDDDDFWYDYFDIYEENVDIFTINVSLDHAPLEISRQLEVPSNIRLDTLADMLIHAMGWDGDHLNQFKANGEFYEETNEEGKAFYEECGMVKNGQYDYTLKNLLNRKGNSIKWEYDFGDSWEHTITLEKRRKKRADEEYAVKLLKCKGACPPENCGGIPGYCHMLDVLADPKSPEYLMMKNWAPADFNPKKFNKKEAQSIIDDYFYL